MFIPYDDFIKYVAGFFDGEGCVMIEAPKIKTSFGIVERHRLKVTITQNVKEILEEIQKVFGGTVRVINSTSLKKLNPSRPVYVLEFPPTKAAIFLSTIKDYIYVKRKQIELALEFYETMNTHNLIGINPKRQKIDEKIINKRKYLKNEVSRLKHAAIWEQYAIKEKGRKEHAESSSPR